MRELLASANPMTRKLLASESPEKLVKTQIAAPSPRGSGAVCLEWVLRLCISGRLPADADAICSRDQTDNHWSSPIPSFHRFSEVGWSLKVTKQIEISQD